MELTINSPLKQVFSGNIKSITLPTLEGRITVLPGHMPLVVALAVGEAQIQTESEMKWVHISGGVAQIGPKQVKVVADDAQHTSELDEESVSAHIAQVKEQLASQTLSNEEQARTLSSLENSLSKISAIKRHHHRGKHSLSSEGVLHG